MENYRILHYSIVQYDIRLGHMQYVITKLGKTHYGAVEM